MKRRISQAFTLVELLLVLVIIAVIAGLVIGVAGPSMRNAAARKAAGDIKELTAACESYKTDNGVYPRAEGITESSNGTTAAPIDPRKDGDPTATVYAKSSEFLYRQLTGKGTSGGKSYISLRDEMLGRAPGSDDVSFLKDPWGNSYGYSTAAAKAEEAYTEQAQAEVKSEKGSVVDDKGYQRDPLQVYGFNTSFDLWSTAGTKTTPPTPEVQNKWQKNW